jgi:hypothetical protein
MIQLSTVSQMAVRPCIDEAFSEGGAFQHASLDLRLSTHRALDFARNWLVNPGNARIEPAREKAHQIERATAFFSLRRDFRSVPARSKYPCATADP